MTPCNLDVVSDIIYSNSMDWSVKLLTFLLPALPTKEALAEGSNFAFVVTARGGHLGFLEGLLPTSRPMHYMERFVYQFLLAYQDYGDKLK